MARRRARWLILAAAATVTCTTAGLFLSTANPVVTVRPAASTSVALPSASSTPNVTVDFGSTMRTIDPEAIGVDETTFGAPLDVSDPAAQHMLSTLGVGYSRISLRFKSPGDPGSGVVCAAAGCDTSITGDTWVSMQKSIGETPVIGIADSSGDVLQAWFQRLA